jgi:hypothetical protein
MWYYLKEFYKYQFVSNLDRHVLQTWFLEDLNSDKVDVQVEKETLTPKFFKVKFSDKEYKYYLEPGFCYVRVDNFVWRDAEIINLDLCFTSSSGNDIKLDYKITCIIKSKIAWLLCQSLEDNMRLRNVAYAKLLNEKF